MFFGGGSFSPTITPLSALRLILHNSIVWQYVYLPRVKRIEFICPAATVPRIKQVMNRKERPSSLFAIVEFQRNFGHAAHLCITSPKRPVVSESQVRLMTCTDSQHHRA